MSANGVLRARLLMQVDDRTIYIAAAIASVLLSAWAGYARSVPNNDAMFYLRAAEFFAAGRWGEGIALYPWPLYSALIAAVMTATGLSALIAVQVVNTLIFLLATLSFIALVGRLAEGDRLVTVVAAAIVVLHPQLTELRPMVIRDGGFLAFVLLAAYLFVRDWQTPQRWSKLAAAGAFLIAALFRVEALFVAALAPPFLIYARATSRRERVVILATTVVIGLLLVPGYLLWASGVITRWLAGDPGVDLLRTFMLDQFQAVRAGAQRLEHDVMPIFGRNRGILAYASIVVGVTVDGLLRALTWPLALLSAFAFWPRRLLPEFARRFVLWFAAWQVPVVLLFALFHLFLDWRYAMMFGLVMTIPAVFTVTALLRAWKAGEARARWQFPAAALLVVGAWLADFPKPHRLGYLREAGQWLDLRLPRDAVILTNDGRIAYYSNRPYETRIRVRTGTPTPHEMAHADFAVIVIDRPGFPEYILRHPGVELLARPATEGRYRVDVFRLNNKRW